MNKKNACYAPVPVLAVLILTSLACGETTPTNEPEASTATLEVTETEAPPEQATHTPEPATVSKPVEIVFNVSERIESGKVYLDVETNLPAGMQVMFTVTDSEGNIAGQAKGEVANSAISVGPFSSKGEPYFPGTYTVSISSPLLQLQPPNVQEVLGNSGENVYGECISKGRVDCERLFAVEEQSSPEGREVTKEEFGEDWPFTVERGFVDCTNLSGGLREAVFRSGGMTYALNGTARSRAKAQGYEDVMDIWRDDPNNPGLKIDIGPILDLALQECD
jgi:hypothetical protein